MPLARTSLRCKTLMYKAFRAFRLKCVPACHRLGSAPAPPTACVPRYSKGTAAAGPRLLSWFGLAVFSDRRRVPHLHRLVLAPRHDALAVVAECYTPRSSFE